MNLRSAVDTLSRVRTQSGFSPPSRQEKNSDNLPAAPVSAHRWSEPVKFYAGKQDACARVSGASCAAHGICRFPRRRLSPMRVARDYVTRTDVRNLRSSPSLVAQWIGRFKLSGRFHRPQFDSFLIAGGHINRRQLGVLLRRGLANRCLRH